MMKTVKKIPELRFPEFEGEWVTSRIGDLTDVFAGGTPSTLKSVFWNGNIRWMNSGELNLKNVTEVEGRITDLGLKNSSTRILPKHCILIGLAGQGKTRGTAAINMIELCTNQSVAAILPQDKLFDSFFLFHNIDFRYDELRNLSTGEGGRGGLNLQIIKSVKVSLPTLPEQQKIASFLSSADQRIQLLTQKKEKLEQYKKGIMQQIFSQKLRFKDENGKDYPEWEEKQFGSIYRFISTNSLSREKLNYESGHVKNIHYGDIHTKFKSHFIFDNELVPYINTDVDLEKINSDNFLMEGDLVIADASEDYIDIGKSIEICQLNGQLVLAGLHTLQARRKSNYPTIGYGGHMMKSNEVRTQIQRIAQGTKVLSIAANRISDISFKIPCEAEQQKIASFLSNIDNKISLVNQQIELTRKWKQGLLQKMFV